MDDLPDASAGQVVRAQLVELIDLLPVYDSRIRRQERGGVHKMRVTLRRLRSALATFGAVFDADVVSPLRDELKWIAGELGGARDSEVVLQRVTALATTPEERSLLVRIKRDLGAAESAGVDRGLVTLDSERYSQVLRDLSRLVNEPPWTPDAGRSADDLLRLRVRREWKRLRLRVNRTRETARGTERQAALHEVRKAAKRLRYSAAILVPAYGDDARRLVRGAKRIQTDLGELQDSAVSQELLSEMANADDIETHEAFVLGGLHTKERVRSAQAEDHFARSWGKVSRKRTRRWLT